jgi:hypothetical protein
MLNKTFSRSIYARDELHMFVGGKAYTSCASFVINGVENHPLVSMYEEENKILEELHFESIAKRLPTRFDRSPPNFMTNLDFSLYMFSFFHVMLFIKMENNEFYDDLS